MAFYLYLFYMTRYNLYRKDEAATPKGRVMIILMSDLVTTNINTGSNIIKCWYLSIYSIKTHL